VRRDLAAVCFLLALVVDLVAGDLDCTANDDAALEVDRGDEVDDVALVALVAFVDFKVDFVNVVERE